MGRYKIVEIEYIPHESKIGQRTVYSPPENLLLIDTEQDFTHPVYIYVYLS